MGICKKLRMEMEGEDWNPKSSSWFRCSQIRKEAFTLLRSLSSSVRKRGGIAGFTTKL